MDDDLNACADLVRRADPERFMAAMAAPVAARRVLFPLYALNAEVARAPWLTQEPMIAEMRLQWWRDVLEEIGQGAPVRRHEVATPLSQVLDADGATLLDDLILARRWDIYKDPFEDAEAFERHLIHSSGYLMWVAARALGAQDQAAVLEIGYAHGLSNWLRAVPALENAKRIPLVDGRPEAVRALAEQGLARLARAGRTVVPKAARAALLPAWKTKALLQRAVENPHNVAEDTLDVSPIRSRVSLIWAAAVGRL